MVITAILLVVALVIVGAVAYALGVRSALKEPPSEPEVQPVTMDHVAYTTIWRAVQGAISNGVEVELPKDAERTMREIRRTCTDIRGFINLYSRWLVMQMPEEAIKDMEPPEDWLKGASRDDPAPPPDRV